jgi:hypothetical protein
MTREDYNPASASELIQGFGPGHDRSDCMSDGVQSQNSGKRSIHIVLF